MSNEIQFLLYNLPDKEGRVQVVIKDETIWCTQKAMAQLFGIGIPAISKHLKNIFEEGELQKEVVVSKMEITTQHGAIEEKMQRHNVDFYNLDAIISVGYRVKSQRGVHFRIWATGILKEYMRPVLIMIPMQRYPFGFLRKSKTRFIMPFMDKQRRRSFTHAPMLRKNLWV